MNKNYGTEKKETLEDFMEIETGTSALGSVAEEVNELALKETGNIQ